MKEPMEIYSPTEFTRPAAIYAQFMVLKEHFTNEIEELKKEIEVLKNG